MMATTFFFFFFLLQSLFSPSNPVVGGGERKVRVIPLLATKTRILLLLSYPIFFDRFRRPLLPNNHIRYGNPSVRQSGF